MSRQGIAEYSPEPWRLIPFGDSENPSEVVVYVKDALGMSVKLDKVDQRRIVACVNACKGLSTEDLLRGDFDFTKRPYQN